MGTFLTDGPMALSDDYITDQIAPVAMPDYQTPGRSPSSGINPKRLSTMGTFLSVMGGINSAIGSFYAAKSQQYQFKSQALNDQFQSDMASINSRQAEYSAESTLEAGKNQVSQYTLAAGQQKAAATASMASRGIVLGQGSAQDVAASMDLVKNIDMLTINANAVRSAEAQRMQAVNFKNESLLANTSAANATMSAKSISPLASMTTSLLGSASSLAQQWNNQERMKQYLAAGGYGMPMMG